MADKAIAIDCFVDNCLKASTPKEYVHCQLNNAEITTTALLAGSFANIRVFLSVSIDLPVGNELYGDKGCTDCEQIAARQFFTQKFIFPIGKR